MAAMKPITGMLRRRLVLDLSIGLGAGFAVANWYWYGYHLKRTAKRDIFYSKLEEQRAAEKE